MGVADRIAALQAASKEAAAAPRAPAARPAPQPVAPQAPAPLPNEAAPSPKPPPKPPTAPAPKPPAAAKAPAPPSAALPAANAAALAALAAAKAAAAAPPPKPAAVAAPTPKPAAVPTPPPKPAAAARTPPLKPAPTPTEDPPKAAEPEPEDEPEPKPGPPEVAQTKSDLVLPLGLDSSASCLSMDDSSRVSAFKTPRGVSEGDDERPFDPPAREVLRDYNDAALARVRSAGSVSISQVSVSQTESSAAATDSGAAQELAEMRKKLGMFMLGGDMSGGQAGTHAALTLSNAITNLSVGCWSAVAELSPLPSVNIIKWRQQVRWYTAPLEQIIVKEVRASYAQRPSAPLGPAPRPLRPGPWPLAPGP